MGYLPELTEIETKRDMIYKFSGLDHNLYVKDGDMYDERNMTSDYYPVLSPRGKRHKIRKLTTPNGLFAHTKLAWVDGTGFYYNGICKGTVMNSVKQMVAMGAYILIFPDKKYYNTSSDEFGSLGNAVTTSGTVTTTLCKQDGTPYGDVTASTTAPASPSDGQYWIDTSATPHALKQYSTSQSMWVSVATTYVKIACTGIGVGFSALDTVTIAGMMDAALNGDFSLQAVEDGYVVITAIIDATGTQTAAATLERKIPDMDFVTESDNRVWGCSNANHEIYASKQGDPKNWYSYLGIASDSYAMTVGTKGDFTGAVTHLGYITFFKEDIIQKIYGSKPANFQLVNTEARGVEKGSEKSLTMLNETLFYNSKSDICCYATSLPQGIARQLGTGDFKNAAGGALGRKYYISMQDSAGGWGLYTYDTDYGCWHREDDTHALYFAAVGSELYFIDSDGWIWNLGGKTDYDVSGTSGNEGDFEWYAETGPIGMDEPDRKYISKLQFRMQIEQGAEVRLYISYDEGDFSCVYRFFATERRSFTVPIVPKRCDTMRLKFSGNGGFKLYSIAKTTEQGGDA